MEDSCLFGIARFEPIAVFQLRLQLETELQLRKPSFATCCTVESAVSKADLRVANEETVEVLGFIRSQAKIE